MEVISLLEFNRVFAHLELLRTTCGEDVKLEKTLLNKFLYVLSDVLVLLIAATCYGQAAPLKPSDVMYITCLYSGNVNLVSGPREMQVSRYREMWAGYHGHESEQHFSLV